MSATATPARPTVGPIVYRNVPVTVFPPLPDPRAARGKHRTPRNVAAAGAVLAGWRRARVEVAVAAASVGAVLASVIL